MRIYITGTKAFQALDDAMQYCESAWIPIVDPGWRRHVGGWGDTRWERKGVNDAGEIVTQTIHLGELK